MAKLKILCSRGDIALEGRPGTELSQARVDAVVAALVGSTTKEPSRELSQAEMDQVVGGLVSRGWTLMEAAPGQTARRVDRIEHPGGEYVLIPRLVGG